jgi:3',5'-cyclic AMP phosphodiesterase CpdA
VSWEAAATLAASGVQQSTPKLRFAQISDGHIGFHGPANPNITDAFNHAIGQINSLGYTPDFVIHTGDLTHLATPAQFDQVQQMMTGLNAPHVFTVPSEHDSTTRAKCRQAFGAGTRGDGWYSVDVAGVHVRLVNTLNVKKLGHLGTDQLEFIEKDVAPLSSNTPIAVFSHIPLFAMYPDWGWGTDDAAQALSYLKRFASVTCLNGHVHQLFSKTEGNVTFYTGTGADLTLETADAVTVRDELATVPVVVALARRARRVVIANLAIAAAFITGLVAWDLIGNLPLPLGVAGHDGSTIIIALNGLRLLSSRAWRHR